MNTNKESESAIEQIDNLKFTEGEQKLIDYAFSLGEDLFSDEDYYELCFWLADRNGLNQDTEQK